MSYFLIHFQTFSQTTQINDTWLKQGTDVLKKETTGNVGIGTYQPKEKLHVVGDVRIDGLQGIGERIVLVDKDGRLRPGPPIGEGNPGGGRPISGGGGPTDGPRPCKPTALGWTVPYNNTLALCYDFNHVIMGPSNIDLPFNLFIRGYSPNGTKPNVLLKLRNIDNSLGLNEPTILFENAENADDETINENWTVGARATGI